MRHQPAARVQWTDGVLQQIVDRSYLARIRQFVVDHESPAIALFAEETKKVATNGDWYGEHAGKWLVTACAAYRRTQDGDLRQAIEQVAQFLVEGQESNGYLGTYSDSAPCRMENLGAGSVRTWDVWVHAWMMRGLLACHAELGGKDYLTATIRMADHLLATFEDPARVLLAGNHQGLSSAVLVEPMAMLATATESDKYARFAESVGEALQASGVRILDCDQDAAQLGTGKSYQICWVLTGLMRLHEATNDPKWLRIVGYWWENIRAHHLTAMGGPWGGVGTHKEVFNAQGFQSPIGFTETCSTASWMALSRELFFATGEVKYANEFDRSLHNALLGAVDENGADWSYFTFPNGRRNSTYYWACCKSSGAMALEEMAAMAVTVTDRGLSINLCDPFTAEATYQGVRFEVTVGPDSITISADKELECEAAVRVPDWCDDPTGTGYTTIKRVWGAPQVIEWSISRSIRVSAIASQEFHHGQEVQRSDYAVVSFGPYVYAHGLIDGYQKEACLRMANLFPTATLGLQADLAEDGIPAIIHREPGRPALVFRPYFQAGGRHDGAYRTTYVPVAWQ